MPLTGMQPKNEQTLCHEDGNALIKRKQIFPGMFP